MTDDVRVLLEGFTSAVERAANDGGRSIHWETAEAYAAFLTVDGGTLRLADGSER